MIQGFYLTTRDVVGRPADPYGHEIFLKKDTPIAMVYFEEREMHFVIKLFDCHCEHFPNGLHEFALDKPCPIIEAASCRYCGKIVPTSNLFLHTTEDDNCLRVRNMSKT